MWFPACFGHESDVETSSKPKSWFSQFWRYGTAANGEPAYVYAFRWHDTEAEAAMDYLNGRRSIL